MRGFYDYFSDIVTPQPQQKIVVAKTSDGDEPEGYPALVYNLNGQNIGTAATKQDYIHIWNADPVNSVAGVLTGWYGPFAFNLVTLQAMPSDVQGDSVSETEYLIDEDGQLMIDNDGLDLLVQ